MLEALEDLIGTQQLLPAGCRVLCAVSGGADSICLLHALYHLRAKLGFQLTAAHYDHQLRGDLSKADAAFVAQFVAYCCGPQRLADGRLLPPVQLITGTGDVAAEAARRGTGIEETAREMRYAFLRDTAKAVGCDRIATAHNADDNTETILFHLARGTGLRGLTGIRVQSGDLIRPLLTTSRREIEDYLLFYGLPHREDHTNRDDTYARNRIRHQVTPVLEELFSSMPRRIANTAALLRTDEDCLSSLAREIAAKSTRKQGELFLPARLIADSHEAIATRAVREMIGMLTGGDQNCAAIHLKKVVALCQEGEKPSAQIDLPHGLTARREYENLVLSASPRPGVLPLTEAKLPGTVGCGDWTVTCEKVPYDRQPQSGLEFWLDTGRMLSLTIRSRQEGDRLSLPGRHTKTVKKWLIDEKIPRLYRDSLPVLDCGGKVAAVAQLGPDQNFVAKPGAPAWHIKLKKQGDITYAGS